MKTKQLAVMAFATLMTGHVYAHGIWFAQRSDEIALIYGHGAEDGNAVKRQAKVSSFKAYDAAGRVLDGSLKATDYLLLAQTSEPASVFAATLDNGYWSQTPEGKWLNKGRDEVPAAKISGRYLKYTVSYRTTPRQAVTFGSEQRLQIVPLSFPFPTQRNAEIRLRVVLDGKPVAGARVLVDTVNDPDAKPLLSSKDGSVRLRIRNQGLNVISAAVESAPDDAARADKTGHYATLSFVLPHHEE